MVAPHAQSEVDVLAQGGRTSLRDLPGLSRLPGLPELPVWVRRLIASLLVAALVAGWVVDRHLRDTEAARLDACAGRASSAVDGALAPVRSMIEYVRPTLAGTPPGELRRGLYALVRDQVGPTDELEVVLSSCRTVPVLRFHDELRTRRSACVLQLRQTLDFLDRVAGDGRAAFRSWPGAGAAGSAPGCAGRRGR